MATGIAAATQEPWQMTRDEWGGWYTEEFQSLLKEKTNAVNEIHDLSFESANYKRITRAQNRLSRIQSRIEQISNPNYLKRTHKQIISLALTEGKPVPAEVLKDYPELGKTDMAKIVKTLVSQSKMTPYEINAGNCDGFADKLLDVAEKAGMKPKLRENDDVGHVWVECEGKHYDAETPLGVSSWRELSAVKRASKQTKPEPSPRAAPAKLTEQLDKLPGIEKTYWKPDTSTLTVYYDEATDKDTANIRVQKYLAENALRNSVEKITFLSTPKGTFTPTPKPEPKAKVEGVTYYRGVSRHTGMGAPTGEHRRPSLYLTKSEREASFYGKDIAKVTVKPKNPMYSETAVDAAEKLGVLEKYDNVIGSDPIKADEVIYNAAKKAGYDAIIRRDGDWVQVIDKGIVSTISKPEPKAEPTTLKPTETRPGMILREGKPKPIKQSDRAIAIDRSLLAKQVVSVEDSRWLKRPNRFDVRGIDTPGRGRIVAGVAYADQGKQRLSRKHHRGWQKVRFT